MRYLVLVLVFRIVEAEKKSLNRLIWLDWNTGLVSVNVNVLALGQCGACVACGTHKPAARTVGSESIFFKL